MRATLTPAERERIEKPRAENLQAYDEYLRALAIPCGGGVFEACEQRIQLLENAVRLDPAFALAYGALSRAHTFQFQQMIDRSSKRLDLALLAAERALQLEPDLAEAHAALAHYYARGANDQVRAATEYNETLRLEPNNVQALRHNAEVLLGQSDDEGAKGMYLKALALDPLNYRWTWQTARVFWYFHDFEAAERYFDLAIRLQPDRGTAQFYKGLLYLAMSGDTAEARSAIPDRDDCQNWVSWSLIDVAWRLCDDGQYERGLLRFRERLVSEGNTASVMAAQTHVLRAWLLGRLGEEEQQLAAYDSARVILEPLVRDLPEDAQLRSGYGIALAGLGRRDEAVREGRRAVELENDPSFMLPSRVLNLARIYMMVAEYDLAVQQLERLPTDRGMVTPAWLGADPLWDPLRDHPRLQALLEKYEQGVDTPARASPGRLE